MLKIARLLHYRDFIRSFNKNLPIYIILKAKCHKNKIKNYDIFIHELGVACWSSKIYFILRKIKMKYKNNVCFEAHDHGCCF